MFLYIINEHTQCVNSLDVLNGKCKSTSSPPQYCILSTIFYILMIQISVVSKQNYQNISDVSYENGCFI